MLHAVDAQVEFAAGPAEVCNGGAQRHVAHKVGAGFELQGLGKLKDGLVSFWS